MVEPASPAVPPAGSSAPAAPRKGRKGRTRFYMVLAAVLLVPALLFALYVAVALRWSYSQGERAGYVQKFSRKGWVCKTWEGELAMASMPGTMPQVFNFTVRDDAVAAKINQTMGQRVSISYEEHRGVPTSCFGETQYYVNGARPVGP
jgi:hypothetical protein